MSEKCIFCGSMAETKIENDNFLCRCQVCGNFKLEEQTCLEFKTINYTKEQKRIIAINVRNEWENSSQKGFVGLLNFEDFDAFIKRGHLSPLDLMDKVLHKFSKKCKFIGDDISVNQNNEYIYYNCITPSELVSVLKLLMEGGLIICRDKMNPQIGAKISVKGYSRLRELQRVNLESRQCFVAMWFADEMDKIYKDAIRPAIEFVEEGENKPRFKAVRIDTVEHVNDINDEIIAQIRRSRFVVCDLTGYRGGVYFEAGFAFGLGLPVIFTCRKDWCNEDKLYDQKNEEIVELFDSNKRKIQIRKEGIHFDLAHRNRIAWEEGKLDVFKNELENRIKAIIK